MTRSFKNLVPHRAIHYVLKEGILVGSSNDIVHGMEEVLGCGVKEWVGRKNL